MSNPTHFLADCGFVKRAVFLDVVTPVNGQTTFVDASFEAGYLTAEF
jgi:hypothetical protein